MNKTIVTVETYDNVKLEIDYSVFREICKEEDYDSDTFFDEYTYDWTHNWPDSYSTRQGVTVISQ